MDLKQEKLKLQAEIKLLTRKRDIVLKDITQLNVQLRPNSSRLKELKAEESRIEGVIVQSSARLLDTQTKTELEVSRAKQYAEETEKRFANMRESMEHDYTVRDMHIEQREQLIHKKQKELDVLEMALHDKEEEMKITISKYDKLLQGLQKEQLNMDQERQQIDKMRVETTTAHEGALQEKHETNELYVQAEVYSQNKIKESDAILDSARHISQGVTDRISELELREKHVEEYEHKNRQKELWLEDREQTLSRAFTELRNKGGNTN